MIWKFDNKDVTLTTIYDEVLRGTASHNSADYNEHEYGRDEEGLMVNDYLTYASEISNVELIEYGPDDDPFRIAEEQQAFLFSLNIRISEHLTRWEDNELPDKYDHNCFEYSGQPTKEEFRKALEYQVNRKDSFIKLEGDLPLEDSFGLEESVTLTMALDKDPSSWKTNPELEYHEPRIRELEKIEVKHFGAAYGEDFTRRNIHWLAENLDFYGAYLDGKLVGACHSFTYNGYTCLDGLIVDEDYRNRYVATSLMKHVMDTVLDKEDPADEAKRSKHVFFLHADADDTPVQMYRKLGFKEVGRLYEYLCTDIRELVSQYGIAAEENNEKQQ